MLTNSKWPSGIEGFVEAVAQEAAPFGVDFIIAEPGPTGTNFGGALGCAEPSEVYGGTPAGEIRRLIASGEFVIHGDAGNTVHAVIEAAGLG
jgi:NAD(P)-dependent dehydrogenase (short-subunit alcohol dehydrogenase family)